MIITTTIKPRLKILNGQITTTSLDVAEKFGKSHDNVLRDIRNLMESMSAAFASINFEEVKETTTYKSSVGEWVTKKTSRTGHYRMTRNGFSILAMGFTGKAAMKWKEAYINAFSFMETRLVEVARAVNKIEQSSRGKALDFSDPDNLPPMTPEVFLHLWESFDHQTAPTILVWWAIQKHAYKAPVVASYREIAREIGPAAQSSALHRAMKKLSLDGVFNIGEELGASNRLTTRFELILDAVAERVAARMAAGNLDQFFSDKGLAVLAEELQSTVLH